MSGAPKVGLGASDLAVVWLNPLAYRSIATTPTGDRRVETFTAAVVSGLLSGLVCGLVAYQAGIRVQQQRSTKQTKNVVGGDQSGGDITKIR